LQESNSLSGVLQSKEGKPVVFFANRDTHEFNFVTDVVYNPTKSNPAFYLEPQNGFAFGKTHNGHNVAVYIGQENFLVIGRQRMFLPAYIVSSSNVQPQDLTTFRGIRFIGNTLNKVFPIEIVRFLDENNELVITEKDKFITYNVSTKKYSIELTITAPDPEKTGPDGVPISNTDVMLDLLFDDSQPLFSLFDHYNRIKELLSFMTFRFNVGFKGIELIERDSDLGFITKKANVYIHEDVEATAKDERDNISFHDLDGALPNLFKMFYDTEEKKPSYSLGFYPEKDDDSHRMTNGMIREICSGVECELSYIPNLNEAGNELLANLIARVRDEIKSFRQENEGLSNDTYNMIFSSIGNWSFTLAEKTIALFQLYAEEMQEISKGFTRVYDTQIRSFVKYRNDITHGKHRVLDYNIATTAHVLAGLVYCCILSRIGLTREKILELCKDGKIVS